MSASVAGCFSLQLFICIFRQEKKKRILKPVPVAGNANAHADRQALLINLRRVIGYGWLLVAGTYKRGINFIQIPTTLLSMQMHRWVETWNRSPRTEERGRIVSSAAGSTHLSGISETLPERELFSGYAEVLAWTDSRCRLLNETAAGLPMQIKWSDIIRRSVMIKQEVVKMIHWKTADVRSSTSGIRLTCTGNMVAPAR